MSDEDSEVDLSGEEEEDEDEEEGSEGDEEGSEEEGSEEEGSEEEGSEEEGSEEEGYEEGTEEEDDEESENINAKTTANTNSNKNTPHDSEIIKVREVEFSYQPPQGLEAIRSINLDLDMLATELDHLFPSPSSFGLNLPPLSPSQNPNANQVTSTLAQNIDMFSSPLMQNSIHDSFHGSQPSRSRSSPKSNANPIDLYSPPKGHENVTYAPNIQKRNVPEATQVEDLYKHGENKNKHENMYDEYEYPFVQGEFGSAGIQDEPISIVKQNHPMVGAGSTGGYGLGVGGESGNRRNMDKDRYSNRGNAGSDLRGRGNAYYESGERR